MKNVLILGSARKNSNTLTVVKKTCPFKEYELIDLLDFNVDFYNYDHRYSSDDNFLEIVKKLEEAENIIFATPVYWYSMSGKMKVFFDRLTDLITVKKDLGRSLKGKSIHLICTGSDEVIPDGFEVPFKRTAQYLGMKFGKTYYAKS